MSEEDLKEYLEEPVAALPPDVARRCRRFHLPGALPGACRDREKKKLVKAASSPDYVSIDGLPTSCLSTSTQLKLGEETVLAFALKDQEVAEYHYRLFHLLATLMAEHRGRRG